MFKEFCDFRFIDMMRNVLRWGCNIKESIIKSEVEGVKAVS